MFIYICLSYVCDVADVYMCISLFAVMWMSMWMYGHTEVRGWCRPVFFLTTTYRICWDKVFPLKPESPNLANSGRELALEMACVHFLSDRFQSGYHAYMMFIWVLGIQTILTDLYVQDRCSTAWAISFPQPSPQVISEAFALEAMFWSLIGDFGILGLRMSDVILCFIFCLVWRYLFWCPDYHVWHT